MNLEAYKGIMVYSEINGEKIIDNSLELIGEAKRLAAKLGNDTKVLAVLIGKNVKDFSKELINYGADKVIIFEDNKLEYYRPDLYSEALEKIVNKYKPEIVLIGATYQGEEIGPTTAKKLDTGMAAHCVELRINDKRELVQVVPAFGGKVLGDILCHDFRPQMASVKAGLMKKLPYEEREGIVEEFNCAIRGFGDNIKVKSVNVETKTLKSLNEADVIIGGGFGIGSKDGWQELEKLAKLLNGATGCTRPALDESWTEDEHTMIGTSGVAVKPKLYINAGISGAAHHTCGIKDADVIISINKDDSASIFDVSDFKVVADWKKIIPLLNEKLETL
ncbi:electron transfer flavoprotein subunit alpha/FixB family protein [Maledivibacter halophilus]|uniref:Electron transfer flavoprotein alpha subunit apoprotein n=1 Tax=Maledivibacter halophilus TaxID=36842 RepID=A0A1T5IGV5_9FIRM|nr:electron transfer flavoprotein subunit alpha/FixB family protein [Maledivibacter halophilus]SKC38298.1 electron transfer flavoprotein alpha subunit apoprotein [Maledivibacter halophilus]